MSLGEQCRFCDQWFLLHACAPADGEGSGAVWLAMLYVVNKAESDALPAVWENPKR